MKVRDQVVMAGATDGYATVTDIQGSFITVRDGLGFESVHVQDHQDGKYMRMVLVKGTWRPLRTAFSIRPIAEDTEADRLLRRWRAIDAESWHVVRHAKAKAELMSDTDAYLKSRGHL